MAKAKNLTTDQCITLRGLSLQEKLNLLHQWKKNGEITPQQFNHFSNLWINRDAKKQLSSVKKMAPSVYDNDDKGCVRSHIEGEMQFFIDKMRNELNNWLTNRSTSKLIVNEAYINKFTEYLNTHYRSKVNRLLILGLRYPNKELNRISAEFIRSKKMHPYYSDAAFWLLLWEDGNLIPNDAIRLMLVERGDTLEINNCFDTHLIRHLIPLIEVQRNKEIQRLVWAQSLEDETQREKEVARKTQRLEMFNTLLESASRYVNK